MRLHGAEQMVAKKLFFILLLSNSCFALARSKDGAAAAAATSNQRRVHVQRGAVLDAQVAKTALRRDADAATRQHLLAHRDGRARGSFCGNAGDGCVVAENAKNVPCGGTTTSWIEPDGCAVAVVDCSMFRLWI